eukprot:SAG31_NODE_5085_length_2753_cov_2.660512_1_plen_109_part_00
MTPLLAVLASAVASTEQGEPQGSQGWFVDPITVKVMHDRRLPFASSSKRIDVAGMRGECERVQIWGWSDAADLSDVALAFADLELKPLQRGAKGINILEHLETSCNIV